MYNCLFSAPPSADLHHTSHAAVLPAASALHCSAGLCIQKMHISSHNAWCFLNAGTRKMCCTPASQNWSSSCRPRQTCGTMFACWASVSACTMLLCTPKTGKQPLLLLRLALTGRALQRMVLMLMPCNVTSPQSQHSPRVCQCSMSLCQTHQLCNQMASQRCLPLS